MTEGTFNSADVAIAGFVLVSALWAFVRGFVRELLGLLGWIGAGAIAVLGLPYLLPYMLRFITIRPLAETAAAIIIFLAALVFLSMLSGLLAGRIRASAMNSFDRVLGFVFGLVRGGALICLVYIPVSFLLSESDLPWLTSARSFPLIKRGANFFADLVPNDKRSEVHFSVSGIKERAAQGVAIGESLTPVLNQLLHAGSPSFAGDTASPAANPPSPAIPPPSPPSQPPRPSQSGAAPPPASPSTAQRAEPDLPAGPRSAPPPAVAGTRASPSLRPSAQDQKELDDLFQKAQ